MGNVGEIVEVETVASSPSLPLLSLNHVSFVCKSVSESVKFYEDVLGFVLIKRPESFKFEGAWYVGGFYGAPRVWYPGATSPRVPNPKGTIEFTWLFNHGIGIHLLESDKAPVKKSKINPKDNHISFQCSDMELIMRKLDAMNIEYVTAVVEDGGIQVDQLFFHDPDGYMVEICNCQNLPVLPLSSCPLKLPNPNYSNHPPPSFYEETALKVNCSGEVALLMMENLVKDLLKISI